MYKRQMLLVLFLFQGSSLVRQKYNRYDENIYANETAPFDAGTQFTVQTDSATVLSDSHAFVVFIGDTDSASGTTIRQWCTYTKRNLLTYRQISDYRTYREKLPDAVLLDAAFVEMCIRDRQGISYYNYFNDIIVPDQDKTLLEENLPTDSEINALLELAADDDTAFLVFSLAVKCGLTSSEISKLDVEHIVIDVQERFCIQFPPSRKTSRIIRLPKDINDLLQTYIEKYNRIEGAVFYNKHQTRLKVRDAQRILNHYIELGMECQKIHKHFTFQDLRHSAFKYMLAGGASEDLSLIHISI